MCAVHNGLKQIVTQILGLVGFAALSTQRGDKGAQVVAGAFHQILIHPADACILHLGQILLQMGDVQLLQSSPLP